MATLMAPYFPMDSTHQGASVVVAAYTLMSYIIVVAIVRFYVGHGTENNALNDVAGEAIACVLLIVSFVVNYEAANAGLGIHQSRLSGVAIDRTFQYVYAAQLIGILAMWAAKISIAMLHYRIERRTYSLSMRLKVSFGVAGAWGIVCFLLIAFQCVPPAPWTRFGTTCPSSGATQYTVIALNMASDMWLAVAPLSTVYQCQMPWDRKRRIMFLLASRFLVPCICIGQAVAVSRTQQAPDKTWLRSVQVIWEMVVAFFSVLCCIVPRTQKFWAGLQSGRAHVEDREGEGIELSSGRGNRYLVGQSKDQSHMNRSQHNRSRDRRSVHLSVNGRATRTSEDSERALFPLRAEHGLSRARIDGGGRQGVPANVVEKESSDPELDNVIMHTREYTVVRE